MGSTCVGASGATRTGASAFQRRSIVDARAHTSAGRKSGVIGLRCHNTAGRGCSSARVRTWLGGASHHLRAARVKEACSVNPVIAAT